jgi:hypothetical protein
MKTFILLFLTSLFVFIAQTGNSQCDYSFSSFEETIILNGDPAATPLNSISSCGEYLMSYEIEFNSSTVSTINDVITIHLPVGATYTSLSSTNGTVTGISGTNNVSFTLSGWNVNDVFEIELLCISPSCSATVTSGATQISGSNACLPANSTTVTLTSPELITQNLDSGPILKNIGDVDELVFKIRNNNGNGAFISTVLCDFQLNSNISTQFSTTTSINNTYYLSTSPAQGTGANIYTYTLPSGVTPVALPSGGEILIGSAEWLSLLGDTYLADHEEIYLHIPYKVVSCDNSSNGIFDFSIQCGTSTCQNQVQHSVISSSSATPIVHEGYVSTAAHAGNPNATFCAAAGGQNMQLDWQMQNVYAPPSGGPTGYGRMTDLELFLLVDNTFGEIDPATFSISGTSGSVAVPASLVSVESTTFPTLDAAPTPHLGTVYKIRLNQLAVAGNNWAPLGTNSLADLDGDGFIDDMIESGIVNIHVNYSYHSDSCGLDKTAPHYYSLANLQWRYRNHCGDIMEISAHLDEYHHGNSGCSYEYLATGTGGELTLPPDVLAGTDFVSEICFAPYSERFPVEFGLNCPDGFHRVIYDVPAGYFVRTTGLTPSTSNPGWFELPQIQAVSVGGVSAGSTMITPILKVYCNPSGIGRIVEVRFGQIPSDNAWNRPHTYQIPCISIPMYLDCDTIISGCSELPNNFGFDSFKFRFEYVCDETCESCSAYIVGSGTSSFHHCLGECDSYFATDPNPVFERDALGHNNPVPPGLFDCTDLAQPSNLNVNTQPTINLKTAYPGDPIALNVNGKFVGSPAVSFPSLIGNSFENMYLQIRYEDLPASSRKEARIFDLDDQYVGDGIMITESGSSPLNQYFMPVSDIQMSDFVNLGIVHLNLNFSEDALDFMSNTSKTYLFEANLHMRVRMDPISSTEHTFFRFPVHVVPSLRFEYKGTELATGQIDGSCDDYGANFKILQPDCKASEGSFNNPYYTKCNLYELSLRFYNDAALYHIGNDFPNEYRPYGELSPDFSVNIPAGYNYEGAYWKQDIKPYNSGAVSTNHFGNAPPIDYTPAISGESVTTDAFGNTQIDFHGLTGPGSCWPLKDLEYMSASQYIVLKLQPTCTAPVSERVYVTGGYTLSVQQPSTQYQLQVPFAYDFPMNHDNPAIDIVNPSATVYALNGNAVFNFSICNQSFATGGYAGAIANQPWIAFENSAINGLDLTTAVLTSGTTTVPFTTYTDLNGYQGIIANLGTLGVNACMNLQLNVPVNANGCVNGTDPVLDFLHVLAGNSCDGTILTQPQETCLSESTDFSFMRYPSDLEVLLPNDAFPPNAVEMCNGELDYHFVLNSFEIGAVSDLKFWLDLPTGIELEEITFDYPALSTPSFYTLNNFGGTNYGSGANLGGWNVLSYSNMTVLPGSNQSPDNQIHVYVKLKSTCDYDLTEIGFYTNALNSCNVNTETVSISNEPEIVNTTVINDIEVISDITFSDNDTMINCDNTATVTLTVHNNSTISNITDFDLIAHVPGSPFTVIAGSGGTLSGNEITWSIPAGNMGSGSTNTVTYTISLPEPGYCQSDILLSAEIEFSQEATCTSTGGYCSVILNATSSLDTLDACCDTTVICDLSLSGSSTPVYCKSHLGSATVSVSGANGNVTYLWNDAQAQTTATATDLFQGTYTVIVTDENGCVDSVTVTVGAQNSPLTVTAIPDQNPICEGESVSIALGGATNYTVSSGMYGTTSSGAPVIVSPTGTTTYTVNGTDEFGCFGTTTVTIEVDSLIVPLFDSIAPYCFGDSIPELDTLSLNGISGTWSPAINNTATTTYTFTPTAGQCATTTTIQIVINPIVTPTFNPVGPYCAGASIPALQNPSSNGISGSWSPAISNTTTTTYTFTPDADECAVSDTLTITILPNVETIFKKIKTVYCYGETIPALPTTSANGISGTWSPALNNTATTTYTFTPTGSQCATTYTLTITINPIATPTFTQMGPYCVGSTPGSLPLTSNNGVSGSWSPASISTTTAGTTTYTFTPTAGQCATAVTMNITVNPNPVPTISFDGSLTFCSGSSVWLISSSPSNNTWSTGSTNSSINVTTAGSYTVTVNNGNGCFATSLPAVVTVNTTPSAPTISASGPLTFCSGGSVTLTSSATSGNTWSTGATTQSITVTTSGTYTVTRTVNGCTSPVSASITVTVNPTPSAPTITASGPLTFCSGGSVTLTSNATSGNLWSTGATTQSITVNTSGTYTVTRTVNGCTSPTSSSIMVTVTTPVISGPTFSACVGGTAVQLTGTPTGGSWSSSNSSYATISSSGLVTPSSVNAGITTITYSVNNCSTSQNFFVSAQPTISGIFSVCTGATTSLTGSGTPAATNPWLSSNTAVATVNSSGVVSGISAGTSTITYTNSSGCKKTQLITVNASPTISGGYSLCAGSTLQLSGSPTAATLFPWLSSNTAIATVTNSGLVTGVSTGNVIITYRNNSGCTVTRELFVFPNPEPTISGSATFCTGGFTTLTSSASSSYLWSPPPSGGATTQSIVVTSPGTYIVRTTTAFGCVADDTITVTQVSCSIPHCSVTANFTANISGCNATFASSSYTGTSPGTPLINSNYTFTWSISNNTNGATIGSGSGASLGYSFSTPGYYRVCLTVVTNGYTACTDQVCYTVYVSCSGSLVLSTNSTGLLSKFEVKGEKEEVPDNLDYLWDFGDGTFSTEKKPEHKYAKSGTYEVCLKTGLGDLTNIPVTICRTIQVSEDETDAGIVPILSVNPNPTNGQTTILLDGAENRTVEIKLYNMLGEEVTTLFERACCNETMIRLLWNSEIVPPGIYLIKAQVDSKTIIEKVVVGSH